MQTFISQFTMLVLRSPCSLRKRGPRLRSAFLRSRVSDGIGNFLHGCGLFVPGGDSQKVELSAGRPTIVQSFVAIVHRKCTEAICFASHESLPVSTKLGRPEHSSW